MNLLIYLIIFLFVENQTNRIRYSTLRKYLLKIDVLIFYKQELMPSIWFNNIFDC